MIYITQLIYIIEGHESVFHEFEDLAIPLITQYNGELLLRSRPDRSSFIEGSLEPPYEIHLIRFDSEDDFQRFIQNEERKKFLHLKEKSVRSAILIKGLKME